MNKFFYAQFICITLAVCLLGPLPLPLSVSGTEETSLASTPLMNGTILFAPMDTQTTYLIDSSGEVLHTWASDYLPGEAAYLLDDGTLLRTIKLSVQYGGDGGGVQRIDKDGSLLWQYQYYDDTNLSHHDIQALPNGDVLLIAWEKKTKDEAIAAGRNPNLIAGKIIMPDHIIEVKPTGPTSGEIVWEWHVWDHLIQDYDASKANYGVVADHPELIDINFGFTTTDWLHTNSIDYNPALDQILLSVHNFDEIWVIDHSTTTAEAAGHAGGRSGHGGDILYRWGNPQAYHAGTASDQQYFAQHDATWVQPGCPGAGDILVFNNGGGRPGGSITSVDEITPPVDANGTYYRAPNHAYGPEGLTWAYMTNFYAFYIGGATRLPNGDTLICNGPAGRFFEVTPQGETVWEYVNTYPLPVANNVFNIQYIPPGGPGRYPDLDCIGSLSWTKVKPGETLEGTFQVQNIGVAGSLLNWTINASSISWGTLTFSPESGENLTPEAGPVAVHVTVVAPKEKKTDFEGYIHVENQNDPSDFDVVPISLATPAPLMHQIMGLHHPFLHLLLWLLNGILTFRTLFIHQ